MFFYSDLNREKYSGTIDFSRVNSTIKCLEHYSNLLTLEFILKSSEDFLEKCQVEKEIEICHRKIKWWERQYNFSQVEFSKEVVKLKRKWK